MIAGELVHLKGYAGLHPATGAVARFPEAGCRSDSGGGGRARDPVWEKEI